MGDISYLVTHLKDDHKVDMHSGSTFNHRYVKANPHEVENATWMLTVFFFATDFVFDTLISELEFLYFRYFVKHS